MRSKHATVKSLWQLSGEAVLRNQLLPPGLLSPVPDPPLTFTWLSSSSSLTAERPTTQQKERTTADKRRRGRRERGGGRGGAAGAQLFLAAEAEEEEEEEGGEARERAVRRCWDEERGV
ncbi:Integrase catalytic domain-containing protein [Balamuthia mandrillaris]